MKVTCKPFGVVCAILGLGLAAAPALATGITDVPEPGVLSLLGMGGIIALVMMIRNRRK